MVRRASLLALVAVLSAAGCMTFDGQELPRIGVPEAMPEPPLVSLHVDDVRWTQDGRERDAADVAAARIGEGELEELLRRWQDAGLIRGWGSAAQLGESAQFRLSLAGVQSESRPTVSALVTGLSFFLVPSRSRVQLEWQFTLTDLRSGSAYVVPVTRSMTTWVHLAFVPALPFWAAGLQRGEADQALYVYDELARQGAWDSFAVQLRTPDQGVTAAE